MKKILIFLLICFLQKQIKAQWVFKFNTIHQQIVQVLSSPSDNVCWFITNMDSLYKTADGGQNWTKLPPAAPSFLPSGLFVVNSTTAFKWGNGSLFKTTDGGSSWVQVFSGATSQPPVVWMKNETDGVLAYAGQLYHTTNGGDAWSTAGITQPPAIIINSSGKGTVYGIGDSLWVAMQSNGVAYSPDFGNTWNLPANTGLSFSSPAHIAFGSPLLGMAIRSNSSFVYLTKNGGSTWATVDNSLGLNQDVLINGSHCWYIPNPADHFYIKYSADSGTTWVQQLTDPAGFETLEKSRNGFTLWAGTETGSIYSYFDPIHVIPVDFSSITARVTGKSIAIHWKVENEINLSSYCIERSADGFNFSKVALLPAIGSTRYNWLDNAPVNGNNYYRVAGNNINGTIKYSAIVNAKLNRAAGNIIVCNPVIDGKCRLQFINMLPGKYCINLVSVDGRLTCTQNIYHSGDVTEIFNTGNCNGQFVVEIICADNTSFCIPVLL